MLYRTLSNRIVFANQSRRFIVGSNKSVTLHINVTNYNEPAYEAILKITLPSHIHYRRIPNFCRKEGNVIDCSFANPLILMKTVSGGLVLLSVTTHHLCHSFLQVSVEIELDVAGLRSGEQQLQVASEVSTTSKTAATSSHQTKIANILPLISEVDVGIVGSVLFSPSAHFYSPT